MDTPPLLRSLPIPILRLVLAAIVVAAVIGGVLVIQAAQGGDDGSGGTVSTENAPTLEATPFDEEGIGALDDNAPIVGQPAPDFMLRRRDGSTVRLSDLRGKVVWVNFWATWCQPCKKELPDIQKLYDEKRDEGLEVLAINWQERPNAAQDFFDSRTLTLPMLLDRTGSVYDQYRLQGLPDSFFIDRDGNLAAVHFGFLSEEKMRQRLETAGLP